MPELSRAERKRRTENHDFRSSGRYAKTLGKDILRRILFAAEASVSAYGGGACPDVKGGIVREIEGMLPETAEISRVTGDLLKEVTRVHSESVCLECVFSEGW